MSQEPAPLAVPTLGYDILLVGELRLIQPLAETMLQVSDNKDQSRDSSNNHVLPAAVAMLQRRTLPKNSIMRRRNIHLLESLDSINSTGSSAANVVMDHIVLVASYCESNACWRRDIWKDVTSLSQVSKMDIIHQKVTLVAIPSLEGTIGTNQTSFVSSMDNPQQQALPTPHDNLHIHIPIFVCHMQRPESRNIVATMLWNRIQCQAGPCSPLVALQL
jgi:hypothetical protein